MEAHLAAAILRERLDVIDGLAMGLKQQGSLRAIKV
jgi:hypothetical protein